MKAIITAGGTSSRYGKNKLFEKINEKFIIEYSVNAFLNFKEIDEIIIPANISCINEIKNIFVNNSKIKIIEGGNTRQQSVFNALKTCENCDYVLIHDGARPLISKEIIQKCIEEVKIKKALTVAVKTTDTIKKVDENLKIEKTIDRTWLYNTQTPQAFEYNLIKNAHEKMIGENFTDDASMLENEFDVYIIEGDYSNIKITTQSDLNLLKNYLI